MKRLPRPVREQQILDAAVEVFAARGFHLASMDEVSEVADISKPMIYAYLGSKDELFLSCLRRESDRLMEAVSAAVDEQLTSEEQLWCGLRVFFDYVNTHRDSWTVLRRQASSYGEPFFSELAEWRNRAVGVIAVLLSQATTDAPQPMRPDQLEPFAAALVGASESLLDWWLDHPEHTAEGLAMRLMNLVWMGFGDLVEGRSWTPPEQTDRPSGD